ncbi:hypothetical protein [Spirochaeta dissipatitropha]
MKTLRELLDADDGKDFWDTVIEAVNNGELPTPVGWKTIHIGDEHVMIDCPNPLFQTPAKKD